MKGTIKPPTIPEEEKSPLVVQLLAVIEHQSSIIDQLKEQIQQLKDEIARLIFEREMEFCSGKVFS